MLQLLENITEREILNIYKGLSSCVIKPEDELVVSAQCADPLTQYIHCNVSVQAGRPGGQNTNIQIPGKR